jgi:DNA-binding response OmpR family regulator
MMPVVRVLLIEDSRHLQRSVSTGLRKTGYAVDVSGDGEEGLWHAQSNDYDVIILDLMLPRVDGLTVLRRLRAQEKQTHVLILTAKDTLEDRVRGLRLGADDYLVKPFAFEELLARVEALCRRAYQRKSSSLLIHGLAIDTSAKTVARGAEPIELTPREYALLEYLVRRQGEVVSRSEIEEHIYNEQVDPMSNVVDSAICSLRKKISVPGAPPLIHTRRGLGYVLGDKPA